MNLGGRGAKQKFAEQREDHDNPQKELLEPGGGDDGGQADSWHQKLNASAIVEIKRTSQAS